MDEIVTEAPAGWLEFLARSSAQVDAGEIVPMEPFLDRLRASIARMKTLQPEAPRVPDSEV